MLNKRLNLTFDRRIYKATHNNEYWQCDLFDMTNGTFLFNTVDVFSRKVCSVKVNSKNANTLLEAFKQTVEQMGGTPQNLQSDKEGAIFGGVFGEYLKEHDIKLFTVENGYHGRSAPIVERYNQTVKNKIMEWKTTGRRNYNQLGTMAVKYADDYNKKKHSTTGFVPNEVAGGQVEPLKVVTEQHSRDRDEKQSMHERVLKIGDEVIVQNPPRDLVKQKFFVNWNKERYIIADIHYTNPITYSLKLKKGGTLSNQKYYGAQIQKIIPPRQSRRQSRSATR